MPSLTEIVGLTSAVGQIVPGIIDDPAYIPCDGLTEDNSNNQNLCDTYPVLNTDTANGIVYGSVNQDEPNNGSLMGIRDIAFGNGIYIALVTDSSTYSQIYRSTDGVDWIPVGLASSALNSNSHILSAVTWNGAGFIVAGCNPTTGQGLILYSSDGYNFNISGTFNTSVASGFVKKIVTRNNEFLLLFSLENSNIHGSIDVGSAGGLTITTSSLTIGSNLYDACVFKGQWILSYSNINSLYYTYNLNVAPQNTLTITGNSANGWCLEANDNILIATNMSTTQYATWNDVSPSLAGTLRSAPIDCGIAYDGTRFMALSASQNRVSTSTDGINWTHTPIPSTVAYRFTAANTFLKVCNGEFIVRYMNMITSGLPVINAAATVWRGFVSPQHVHISILSSAYGAGLHVAVGNAESSESLQLLLAPFIMTSADGVTWLRRFIPLRDTVDMGSLCEVRWNGSIFVCVGMSSNIVLTSTDGINWACRTLPSTIVTSANYKRAIAFANNQWVLVYPGSTTYFTSPDAITWTSRRFNVSNQTTFNFSQYINIAWNGTIFLIIDQDNSSQLAVWTSTTGNADTWTRQIASGMPYQTANAPLSLVTRGSTFVFSSAVTNDVVWTSTNGTSWAQRSLGTSVTTANCVLINTTNFLIAIPKTISGVIFTRYATSTDGITWTPRDFSIDSNIRPTIGSLSSSGTDLVLLPSINYTIQRPQLIFYYTPNFVKWEMRFVFPKQFGLGTSINSFNYFRASTAINASGVKLIAGLPNFGSVHYVLQRMLGNELFYTILPAPAFSGLTTNAVLDLAMVASNGTNFVAARTLRMTISGVTTNRFVVQTSLDGLNWDAPIVSAGFPTNVETSGIHVVGLIWAGNQYVAFINNQLIYTSPDGVTWTQRVVPFNLINQTITTAVNRIAYCQAANMVMVLNPSAIGAGGQGYWTSPNCITWTRRVAPAVNSVFSTVLAASPNEFVMNARLGTGVMFFLRSTDGINWETSRPNTTQGVNRIFYDGFYFVAYHDSNGGQIMFSRTGKKWSFNTFQAPGPMTINRSGTDSKLDIVSRTNTISRVTLTELRYVKNKLRAPLLNGLSTNQIPFYNYSLKIA